MSSEEFVHIHISLAGNLTNDPHASVPWAKIQTAKDDWIQSDYWPCTVRVADPSKIQLDHAKILYDHWKFRQENHQVAFKFIKKAQHNAMVTAFVGKRMATMEDEDSSDRDNIHSEPSSRLKRIKKRKTVHDVYDGLLDEGKEMEIEVNVKKRKDGGIVDKKGERKEVKGKEKKNIKDKQDGVIVMVPLAKSLYIQKEIQV
jgi:hypothetical protein